MKTALLACIIFFMLCGCTEAPTSAQILPTPSTIPTTTQTSTATPVWFPPTATHTTFPTIAVTPTLDMRPNIGDVLLEDDFSNQGDWTLSYSDAGSVAFGKEELTIAIGEANEYLYSLRESPVFSDFYLEITATPNLCRDLDEYGVLFRVSSANDYYRFSLSCDGRVRLDRVSSGEANHPQPWMYSGSVPPGAPSSSRLGISAIGAVMKFYVNGQYQFTVEDPSIRTGGLGIFARSVNQKAVTVNFSNLVVYEVNP